MATQIEILTRHISIAEVIFVGDCGLIKMAGPITPCLDGRRIVKTFHAQTGLESLELAGCYVIVSDVSKDQLSPEAVHASYMALQKVERDPRTMKTGLLEIRPLFVRKESRTRGPVFCCQLALKLQRELSRRLAALGHLLKPDELQRKILDALKVSLPAK